VPIGTEKLWLTSSSFTRARVGRRRRRSPKHSRIMQARFADQRNRRGIRLHLGVDLKDWRVMSPIQGDDADPDHDEALAESATVDIGVKGK
jgi:hypothetical protein